MLITWRTVARYVEGRPKRRFESYHADKKISFHSLAWKNKGFVTPSPQFESGWELKSWKWIYRIRFGSSEAEQLVVTQQVEISKFSQTSKSRSGGMAYTVVLETTAFKDCGFESHLRYTITASRNSELEFWNSVVNRPGWVSVEKINQVPWFISTAELTRSQGGVAKLVNAQGWGLCEVTLLRVRIPPPSLIADMVEWQTRLFQKLLSERTCGFESHYRYKNKR